MILHTISMHIVNAGLGSSSDGTSDMSVITFSLRKFSNDGFAEMKIKATRSPTARILLKIFVYDILFVINMSTETECKSTNVCTNWQLYCVYH